MTRGGAALEGTITQLTISVIAPANNMRRDNAVVSNRQHTINLELSSGFTHLKSWPLEVQAKTCGCGPLLTEIFKMTFAARLFRMTGSNNCSVFTLPLPIYSSTPRIIGPQVNTLPCSTRERVCVRTQLVCVSDKKREP